MDTAELDVVLESPVSVGMAWLTAVDMDSDTAVHKFNEAWRRAGTAGFEKLQEKGGWVLSPQGHPGPGVLRVEPKVCMPTKGAAAPVYMHVHMLVSPAGVELTGDDPPREIERRIYTPGVADAAPIAQSACSVALRTELAGLPMSKQCRTPAGWELDMYRDEAEAAPRCLCPPPVPVSRQVVPLQTYARQYAA